MEARVFRCITTSRFFDGSRKSFGILPFFSLLFFFDVIDLDPITFVTNAIAKGCGLPMHRIGACNITKSIYSFGCTKTTQQLHSSDIMCAVEKQKNTVESYASRSNFQHKKLTIEFSSLSLFMRQFQNFLHALKNFSQLAVDRRKTIVIDFFFFFEFCNVAAGIFSCNWKFTI